MVRISRLSLSPGWRQAAWWTSTISLVAAPPSHVFWLLFPPAPHDPSCHFQKGFFFHFNALRSLSPTTPPLPCIILSYLDLPHRSGRTPLPPSHSLISYLVVQRSVN